ncbi:MAG: energy transducer TonB [Bacteroidia bacterium]|nr:energy transducer TonB [Bacteroidia bacterium]
MSTITSVKVEKLDEIVFAHRNKEYGAYELRKKYNKTVTRALFIAFVVLIITAGTPFIMALKNSGNNKIVDETIQANLLDVKNQEEELPPPPPPPPPPALEQQVKYTAPVVVDSVDEKVEIATTDEQVNTAVNEEVTEEVVETNQAIQEEEVINFYVIEEKPEYPGGIEAMNKWIAENVKYPEIAKENGVTGKVFIQFVIDKDGKVSNVQLLRGVDPYLDKEALRVISAMPSWTPGKQRGKTVKVSFQIPINFKLN